MYIHTGIAPTANRKRPAPAAREWRLVRNGVLIARGTHAAVERRRLAIVRAYAAAKAEAPTMRVYSVRSGPPAPRGMWQALRLARVLDRSMAFASAPVAGVATEQRAKTAVTPASSASHPIAYPHPSRGVNP